MSRKSKADADATAKRAERYQAIRAELCAAAGLNADSLSAADQVRVTHCCWLMLARQNLENRILSGQIVDIGELDRISAGVASILPSPPHRLEVAFVEGGAICPRCQGPTTAKEAVQAADDAVTPMEGAAPVKLTGDVPIAEPPAPKPALEVDPRTSDNVVRFGNPMATGHVSWSPGADRPRFYGDHPGSW